MKISAPLNDEDFEKTHQDLKELKEALVYWGKIIQRQNKIKFIRNSKKIQHEEEYKGAAAEEESYIEKEKQKFEGEDVSKKTSLKLDKLKIAQVIDKESKMAKSWHEDSEDEDDESDENVFGADDVAEDEEGNAVITERKRGGRGRGGRGGRGGAEKGEGRDGGEYYKKPK